MQIWNWKKTPKKIGFGGVLASIWKGFGLQVAAKLRQVGLKIAILASFGRSWAPLGRILVPMRSQNGS